MGCGANLNVEVFFPKQVYLWGSILENKRLDTLCWARCAVLGVDLAGRAGLGWAFGSSGRAGLGWAWRLALVGALGLSMD